jgi:hypothetical protein
MDSAIMEIGESTEIHKDHSGLNKCIDRDDAVYRRVSSALKNVMNSPRFLDYTRNLQLESQYH